VKTISVYVEEQRYAELKALARQQRRPVAELLRDAMNDFVERARAAGSIKDIPPHRSGPRRGRSARHGLLDEMRGR
jgi:Ribbon-helix-helix protein, copG family